MILDINMVANKSQPDLMAILEDRGHRNTASRRAVVDVLRRKDEGFTAEEVSEDLPGVGRATVYRTIRLLLDAGVLCKLSLPDGAPKYSLSPIEHHHHTVCVRCGTVDTFRDTTMERLLRAIGSDVSGEIVGHRIEVYVTCESCLAAMRN